jgi:hypothetical protein
MHAVTNFVIATPSVPSATITPKAAIKTDKTNI